MYAYDLHELRFQQLRVSVSAADALFVDSGLCPLNKLWTLIAGVYFPSAAETRTVLVSKQIASGDTLPFRGPVSIPLALALPFRFPFFTEGNQIILLPGEGIRVNRDVATAGSTMTMIFQLVESDLPTMKYHDPQKLLSTDRRKRGFARGSILGSVAAAFGGHGGEPGGGGEGGEGGSLPV